MAEPLTWPPLASVAADVAVGARSASSMVDQAINRADAIGPTQAGFVTLLRERAALQAVSIDCSVRADRSAGSLAGVPLAVKDNIALAGYQSHIWRQFPEDPGSAPADDDAPCIRDLETAGAIVIGTTHMAEWAMGVTGANPHLPVVAHPRNPQHVPGGSSSGSAVAVATGVVPVALGTDTGGSVRIPAALCGVVGLRPSDDVIPAAGVVPVSTTLDRVGLLATRVADILAVLSVFSGQRPELDQDAVPRLGIVPEAFALVADPTVAAVLDRACRALASQAEVIQTPLAGWSHAAAAARLIVHAEAAAFHRRRLSARNQSFGPAVRARLRDGERIQDADIAAARERMHAWQRSIRGALQELDVLVSPVCGVASPTQDREQDPAVLAALSVHTYAVSASGCPAVSIPCGETDDDLPVGLQLIGRLGADVSLLTTAQVVEAMLQ